MVILAGLGAILVPLGAILGASWADLGPTWAPKRAQKGAQDEAKTPPKRHLFFDRFLMRFLMRFWSPSLPRSYRKFSKVLQETAVGAHFLAALVSC